MKKTDLSISTLKANLLAPVIAFPFGGILSALFGLAWGTDTLVDGFRKAFTVTPGWTILTGVVGIILHELLHGIGWTLGSKSGWGTVSFGFQLKTLTPYAHIKQPITARAYRIGTALPGLALGILPWGIAMLLGSGLWNLFGVFFTMAAAGDMMILWIIRRAQPDQLIEDHPKRVGCYILTEIE